MKYYYANPKTEEQKAKDRERAKNRRKDPERRDRMAFYQRRYREKYRIKNLVRNAVARCPKNGMECDKVYLVELTSLKPTHCPCCNNAIDYGIVDVPASHTPKFRSPSLDRIDTTKGYIRGNVDIICWRCNALKRDGTLHELRAIITYMESKL